MIDRHLGTVVLSLLLALDAALTAWNWVLQPGKAAVWSVVIVVTSAMAAALISTLRAGAPETQRRSIRSGVAWAGLILAVSLAGTMAPASRLGLTPAMTQRVVMVAVGLSLIATANVIPKTLKPLTELRCEPARAQAVQRFAGWTWVLTGIAIVAIWILAPEQSAVMLTLVVIPLAILLVTARIALLRRQPSGNVVGGRP
jgi:hypothetical protein